MPTWIPVLVAAGLAVAGCRSAVKDFYEPLVNGVGCTTSGGGAGEGGGAAGGESMAGSDGGGGHSGVTSEVCPAR